MALTKVQPHLLHLLTAQHEALQPLLDSLHKQGVPGGLNWMSIFSWLQKTRNSANIEPVFIPCQLHSFISCLRSEVMSESHSYMTSLQTVKVSSPFLSLLGCKINISNFYYLYKNVYCESFKEQIKILMIQSAKPEGLTTLYVHKVWFIAVITSALQFPMWCLINK